MGERDYFTAPELARELDIHKITLQRWRDANTGPDFYRVGGRVRYKKLAVATWQKAQEQNK